MNIYDIQGANGYIVKTEERKPKQNLDQEDFLKLLVAQMKNQDPMSPMDDKEMVAQMAQFSLLEQMRSLNQSFQSAQAFALIGKSVYAEINDPNIGGKIGISGIAEKVMLKSGKITVIIGGREASLEDVKEVSQPDE